MKSVKTLSVENEDYYLKIENYAVYIVSSSFCTDPQICIAIVNRNIKYDKRIMLELGIHTIQVNGS